MQVPAANTAPGRCGDGEVNEKKSAGQASLLEE